MSKIHVISSFFLTSLVAFSLQADEETSPSSFKFLGAIEKKEEDLNENMNPPSNEQPPIPSTDTNQPALSCGNRPQSIRLGMRHIEGNGVGYNQGYSTLEGFFSPAEPWRGAWLPFLDLRGHIFNAGKLAANAGIGIRYLTGSRIWGINTWYDYRKTSEQHYNQVSLGLESLGRIWDFRLNGYLPVGRKGSDLFHSKFHDFKNHYMILSSKREFAMKGINAEVGAHINHFKHLPLYLTAGPYYLEGKGKTAWGGEARAKLTVLDYIQLEGNTSYDNVFKWIGQGQISLVIPLGNKKQIKARKNHSCSQEGMLAERLVQSVDRNEIIPVDRQHKKTKAINPDTHEPYFFFFVDNTSHSQGTFESPFNTLLAAQDASAPHDIIYVFPGDGTDTGMDLGIVLQDSQRLFGASITHSLPSTLGTIQIPSLANQLPSLNQSFGSDATVTVQNNNEVAGFYIQNTNGGNGINQSPTNILNFSATQNTMQIASGEGINLSGVLGEIVISNNTITAGEKSIILTSSDFQNGNFTISNNTLSSTGGLDNISLTLTDCLNTFLAIRNNTIPLGAHSALLNLTNCTDNYLSIENNVISNGTTDAVSLQLTNCANNFFLAKNNNISSNAGGITVSIDSSSIQNNTLTIQDNTIGITGSGNGITTLLHTDATAGIKLNGNLLTTASGNGIDLTLNDQSQASLIITDNLLIVPPGNPISLTMNQSAHATIAASNNNITSNNTTNFLLHNSSQLSGSFTNNQLINNTDTQGCLFLQTDSNTPTISLSFSDNTFSGGLISFEADLSSSSRADVSILNNQFLVSPVVNSNGVLIGTHGSSLSSWDISGNAFSNSILGALKYESSGTGCLSFTSNTALFTSGAYLLDNASGTFSLEPLTSNVGDVVTTGTIINIPAGGCSQ